jgi:hypothetical protein
MPDEVSGDDRNDGKEIVTMRQSLRPCMNSDRLAAVHQLCPVIGWMSNYAQVFRPDTELRTLKSA